MARAGSVVGPIAELDCAGLPYGQDWAHGDVIGCGIDLDGLTVSFWRNGIDLGTAFQNIRRLPYFPAASLSYGESGRGDLPIVFMQ